MSDQQPAHDMTESEIREVLDDIKKQRKLQKKLVKKNIDEFTKDGP